MRGWPGLAALLAVAATAVTGCAEPGGGGGGREGARIEHVHGLAYDPTREALFVATHHGLATGTLAEGQWSWEAVGDARYDFMGFTQDMAEPGIFYSSGHGPGGNLGLRRSLDGGVTWETRSLGGDVDFHALAALASGPGHVAGEWRGALKVSRDGGATWTDHPLGNLRVLALASSDGATWAGSTSGLQRSADLRTWSRLEGPTSGPVTTVAAARDGSLLFASSANGQQGATYRSTDRGATWSVLSPALLANAAAPVHFAIHPEDAQHVFAATARGDILESTDAGVTWTLIREG